MKETYTSRDAAVRAWIYINFRPLRSVCWKTTSSSLCSLLEKCTGIKVSVDEFESLMSESGYQPFVSRKGAASFKASFIGDALSQSPEHFQRIVNFNPGLSPRKGVTSRDTAVRIWICKNFTPLQNMNYKITGVKLAELLEKETGIRLANEEFENFMKEAGYEPFHDRNGFSCYSARFTGSLTPYSPEYFEKLLDFTPVYPAYRKCPCMYSGCPYFRAAIVDNEPLALCERLDPQGSVSLMGNAYKCPLREKGI